MTKWHCKDCGVNVHDETDKATSVESQHIKGCKGKFKKVEK